MPPITELSKNRFVEPELAEGKTLEDLNQIGFRYRDFPEGQSKHLNEIYPLHQARVDNAHSHNVEVMRSETIAELELAVVHFKQEAELRICPTPDSYPEMLNKFREKASLQARTIESRNAILRKLQDLIRGLNYLSIENCIRVQTLISQEFLNGNITADQASKLTDSLRNTITSRFMTEISTTYFSPPFLPKEFRKIFQQYLRDNLITAEQSEKLNTDIETREKLLKVWEKLELKNKITTCCAEVKLQGYETMLLQMEELEELSPAELKEFEDLIAERRQELEIINALTG